MLLIYACRLLIYKVLTNNICEEKKIRFTAILNTHYDLNVRFCFF